MISLKDYAAQKNVSYEAIRKQVTRYKEDLEGHITVVDRTQYLDDEAVAFLDEKRSKNPVIIMEQSKDETIEQLRLENGMLKDKLLAAQEAIIQKDEKILLLTNENHALLTTGKPQTEPEQEIQSEEVAIDVETVDQEQQQADPDQKPGFAERVKMAWKILKGE